MALETIPRREAGAEVWDAAVRAARQRHFFFETAYIDYHADRFTDASLLVLEKGRAIAALPATRHGDEVRSHGGLTFGGVLVNESMGVGRVLESVAMALEGWRAEGVSEVVVKPAPHIYHLVPAEEELFAWYAHGAVLSGRNLAQAVRRGTDVRWSKGRVHAVHRGREADIAIARGEDVEGFMELVTGLLARRHDAAPVHSPAEMRMLADRFPDEIKLFEARSGGELISGVLVFETPAVAHTQYIASSPEGQELHAQDALLAHLVQDVYAEKPWFDFGTSNERDGTINAGLALNKEGYGARSVVYDSYRLAL
jgi:hypothetical protein